MSGYIALLRGINVNGQKKIQMKDLAELFASLGFENIITYIQSGNVVFSSKLKTPSKIGEMIEKGIEKKFKFDVPVLVLEKSELQSAVDGNPFIKVKGIDESKLHITFLAAVPPKENMNKISAIEAGADKLVIAGKNIYLFCPKGYGRTKYTNSVIENKLKVKATTRNWNTVNAILKLTETL